MAESLYDALGGEPALRTIIDDFVDRAFDDIMIGFMFRNADRGRIKRMEFELAAGLLGAPIKYSGRPLRDAHAKHRIMGGQFARRRRILEEVLLERDAPEEVRVAWLAHTDAMRSQVTSDASGVCND